jgi:uncharacterized protein (UPF0147 family)
MAFEQVKKGLEMLKEEVGIPKSLKSKVDQIIIILNNSKDSEETRSHKAEAILSEVSNDSALQPFVRTQIYQIISLF